MPFFRRRQPPPGMINHLTRTYLDVPFSSKDIVKRLGGRWDPDRKAWYFLGTVPAAMQRWTQLPTLLPGEDCAFGDGLFIDMIPSTSWFTNVRSAVSPGDWDRVRKMVYRRAGERCEICGAAKNATVGRCLEAHERFAYDERTGVQRLRRLICLCHACHSATHYGLAQVLGRDDDAFRHLMNVTGMSYAEAEAHVNAAFATWQRRNGVHWTLDLSVITSAGIRLADEVRV